MEYSVCFERFLRYYNKKRELGWTLAKTYIRYAWWRFILFTFLHLLGESINLYFPFALRSLINWFEKGDLDDYSAYYTATIVTVLLLIRPFFIQHGYRIANMMGMEVFCIFYGIYFNKLENISLTVNKYLNISKINNSLSYDTMRVFITLKTMRQIFISPIIITVYTVFLVLEIDWIAAIGIGVLLVMTFVQIMIGTVIGKVTARKAKQADKRNKNLNNTIVGIKTVKFNAWEDVMKEEIDITRKKEKKLSFLLIFIKGVIDSVINFLPIICSLSCIVIYLRINDQADTDLGTVFYILN